MNLQKALDAYNLLVKLSYQAFDIFFPKEERTDKISHETLHMNLDQYLQCVLFSCVLEEDILPGNYLEIIKGVVKNDSFAELESKKDYKFPEDELKNIKDYVTNVLSNIPLFFDLVIHIDSTCKSGKPDFDTIFSRNAFAYVVEFIKNSVEEDVVVLAGKLFPILRPVIEEYASNSLSYLE